MTTPINNNDLLNLITLIDLLQKGDVPVYMYQTLGESYHTAFKHLISVGLIAPQNSPDLVSVED